LTPRGSPAARLAEDPASPMQLPLPFFATPAPSTQPVASDVGRPPHASSLKPSARLPALDRLTVREVLKIVPINRSTLFRWVNSGRFPRRHKAGGWLRSDIEKWLTEHESEEH
jgi:prophage regulatory protein